METFLLTCAAVGSVVAAIGVLVVNSKLDKLTGRVDSIDTTLTSHINALGLHR